MSATEIFQGSGQVGVQRIAEKELATTGYRSYSSYSSTLDACCNACSVPSLRKEIGRAHV